MMTLFDFYKGCDVPEFFKVIKGKGSRGQFLVEQNDAFVIETSAGVIDIEPDRMQGEVFHRRIGEVEIHGRFRFGRGTIV